MNYSSPEMRRALAAEYVLGTMTGAARRRFERLCEGPEGHAFALERRFWERRFSTLGLRLQPVEPPLEAWAGLQDRIRAPHDQVTVLRPAAATARSIAGLRAWAWLATAASVVLSVALLWSLLRPAPGPSYVAYLQIPKSSLRWTVSLSTHADQLHIAAVGQPVSVTSDQQSGSWAAELWWVGANGKRVRLGLLPKSGDLRRRLPTSFAIDGGGVLAVSVEAPGGSPADHPSGPVVLTVPVARSS